MPNLLGVADIPTKTTIDSLLKSEATTQISSNRMASFQLPTLALDVTLADFYNEENKNTGDRVVLVASYPTGLRVDNQKYIYHDEDRPDTSELPEGVTDSERRSAGEILRALGAQKFSFCVGKMPLIVFDPTGNRSDKIIAFRSSVEENVGILPASQQPELHFFEGPAQVVIDDERMKLAPRLPMDGMDNLPHTLHPDVHYELLSKRGLAIAKESFATPESRLLDLKVDWELFEQGHSAAATNMIRAWMAEVIEAIGERPIPFVLKLQQTIFGKGTYIVKTEDARSQLQSELQGLLDFNANRTTKHNHHLMPATFVMTDFVDCKEGGSPSFAITFFVKRDGSHTFINCCEQTLSVHYTWDGSTITFCEQDHFSKYFDQTISDVASFLHAKGYYGCAGIDILEDKQGKQWVVDLNVRPPGSLILGLVKGFLVDERGFNEASLLSAMRLITTKDNFMAKFSKEFAEGRLIMTAWYDDIDHHVGWTSLIVAGETKEEVGSLVGRLRAL
jgi:hypothetical protein